MGIIRFLEETVGFGVEGLHASVDDVLKGYVAEIDIDVLGCFGGRFG